MCCLDNMTKFRVILAVFYCACAETATYQFPVEVLSDTTVAFADDNFVVKEWIF